jgi:magnesium transporter
MTENTTLSLVDQIRACLDIQKPAEIKRLLADVHPSEAAEALLELPRFQRISALTLLPIRGQADVFSFFPLEEQVDIVEELTQQGVVRLVTHLSHDERADLVAELPDALKDAIMRKLDLREQEDIRRLEAYEDDEIGAIMTSDFAVLAPELTAQQAIDALRARAEDSETIYYAYVLDPDRHLLGVVTLKRLITARSDRRIEEFMTTSPISLHTRAPLEDAIKALHKTDLIALPVIDRQDRMVGIVTYDDVHDIVEEEATEDFHRMGGSTGVASFKTASLGELIRRRLPWLILLVFMNIFSGFFLAVYEGTIEAVVALVFFLPVLIGSGGNAGSQSATLMVRALAIGDVTGRDWFRLLRREFLVAALLGSAMGVAIASIGLLRVGHDVAIVVAATMLCVVMVGSLIGMLLPFILARLRMDPATASAPLVTSLCDVCGVLIYFGIATWYFRDLIAISGA